MGSGHLSWVVARRFDCASLSGNLFKCKRNPKIVIQWKLSYEGALGKRKRCPYLDVAAYKNESHMQHGYASGIQPL